MDSVTKVLFLTGRILLGLYFIVPGLMKVLNFGGTAGVGGWKPPPI